MHPMQCSLSRIESIRLYYDLILLLKAPEERDDF